MSLLAERKHVCQTNHEKIFRLVLRILSHPWKHHRLVTITMKNSNIKVKESQFEQVCHFLLIMPSHDQSNHHTLSETYSFLTHTFIDMTKCPPFLRKLWALIATIRAWSGWATSAKIVSTIPRRKHIQCINKLVHFYTKWCVSILGIIHVYVPFSFRNLSKSNVCTKCTQKLYLLERAIMSWLVEEGNLTPQY